MVIAATAGSAVVEAATSKNQNGESFTTTIFKFLFIGFIIVALFTFAIVAYYLVNILELVGGVIDFGQSILNWFNPFSSGSVTMGITGIVVSVASYFGFGR